MKLNSFSPIKINDFIGKKDLMESLKIHIEIAKQNANYLDHCLIYGKSGLGKTTIAKIIANELGVHLKIIQGPEIQNKTDIINAICNLNDFDVLFIDEIHAINSTCYELFYSIMEEHKINIVLGKDGNSKITQIDTPKITIIGATTDIGKLPRPFEERFPIITSIDSYNSDDLETIITSLINQSKTTDFFSKSEIKKIALNSRGTPRIARNLLSRIIDFKQYNIKSLKTIFMKIKIYENGLRESEIKYLELFKENPLSLTYLSQMLEVNEKTIEAKIEPYLFEQELIDKTPRGRVLTKKGKDYIKKIIS